MTPYKYPLDDFDFVTLAKQSRDTKEKERLLVLANIQDGKRQEDIAHMFKISIATVKRTLQRFKKSGTDDLRDRPRSGAPLKLPASKHAAFKEYILKVQDELSGGRITGYDIQDILSEKWGVECSLSTVYSLLHSLNLAWISCRSQHPKQNDRQVLEDFKKTLILKR